MRCDTNQFSNLMNCVQIGWRVLFVVCFVCNALTIQFGREFLVDFSIQMKQLTCNGVTEKIPSLIRNRFFVDFWINWILCFFFFSFPFSFGWLWIGTSVNNSFVDRPIFSSIYNVIAYCTCVWRKYTLATKWKWTNKREEKKKKTNWWLV